jgi:hypothetical protein
MRWHALNQIDLLFIALNNSDALFSPGTRYRDLTPSRITPSFAPFSRC